MVDTDTFDNDGSFKSGANCQFKVALLPWGDLIEDFLNSIDISLETFCREMTGGWLFGYIDALRSVGINTIVFCVSALVKSTIEFTNIPTGAKFCVLPASKIYLIIRRHMINPYGWSIEETFGKLRGLRKHGYAVLRAIAPYWATPAKLLVRELRRKQCQGILCQEYEYGRFDVCVVLGKLLRIPVFATFQGGSWHLSRFENIIRPLTIKACSGMIIAAKSERQRVRAKYGVPPFKMAPIFNPVGIKMWRELDRNEIRTKLEILKDTMVVVWHGRIDIYRKGLDILLDAWKIVCQKLKGKDLMLLMVGTGNDTGKLHRRITAMRLNGVRWVDRYLLDREEIKSYLYASDVYVLSSRHEGFPVAPIEAMACGLPVVATDVNGISDIFQGGEVTGGIVVPSGDTRAMAAALVQVLTNKSTSRKLGERARRRVEDCFSLESVGKQLRNFFSDRGMINLRTSGITDLN